MRSGETGTVAEALAAAQRRAAYWRGDDRQRLPGDGVVGLAAVDLGVELPLRSRRVIATRSSTERRESSSVAERSPAPIARSPGAHGAGGDAAVDLHDLGLGQAVGRGVEDDLAVAETDDAVGPGEREVDLVQAAHDGQSLVDGDLADERHDLLARLGVERGDGLVGEQDLGVLHERAGDGDALLLSAGEGVGALVGAVEQADAVEVVERLQLRGRGRTPRGRDAVRGRAASEPVSTFSSTVSDGHELELLEDEADAAAQPAQGALPESAATSRRAPRRCPAVGPLEAVEVPQQRRLARARRGRAARRSRRDGRSRRRVVEGDGRAEALRDAARGGRAVVAGAVRAVMSVAPGGL